MRILMVHNYYKEPGGEDIVYESEAALLESRGHEVYREEYRNTGIPDHPPIRDSIRLAVGAIWSPTAQAKFGRIIEEFQPDVAHFHNTFLQVPPSVFARCREAGVAVVQTLHNYRLLCPSATFFRDGNVCTDCLGRTFAWPGVMHGCYRNSRGMSAAVAALQTSHRVLGTWTRHVDLYLALSQHSRDLFIKGGLAPESIVVKPNFLISDVGPGDHTGGFAIFVGRLSREKGLQTLIEAWDQVDSGLELKIVGDGPLAPFVAQAAERNPSIHWLGRRSTEEVLDLVGQALALIFPSEWHETFGRTVVEAFARGTPVIASDLGAAQELIEPGTNGLRYEAGDPTELARCVNWLGEHPSELEKMRAGARRAYLRDFTADRNYELLIAAYRTAIRRLSGTDPVRVRDFTAR